MTTAEKLRQQGIQQGIEKGIQQGIEKGLEKGIQQGIEKGIQQGRIELVRKLLTLKFGALPASALQRLNTASEAELDRYAERVLSANALEAVFD